ncbi:hypothetical protein PVAND_002952 [Polypedilum vanderplanki]|uniref:Zinc finger protein n=1 Tax=Polypedilum vanderplanki TaxID=319348 RepID=A0A9J6BSN9_POLVA|nr:hypothetical protein PVAND_002952 [Polypedilum vanderplanki]
MNLSDESDHESRNIKKKSIDTNKRCPVKGCTSQIKDGIKFFSFPRSKKANRQFLPQAKLWSFFTRIKDFQPIHTQSMCELHFSNKCIIINTKDGSKKSLKHKSVPTIYYQENGEKIEVLYDQINMEYYGEAAEKIVKEIEESAAEEKQNLMSQRQKRLQEIKKLCRFCFTNRSDVKLLEMSKLESYSIIPIESMKNIGLSMKYSEIFNSIICANCFEKIVDFENYKKRCIYAQNELFNEMEELDKKVEAARSKPNCVNVVKQHNDNCFSIKIENLQNEVESDAETDVDVNDKHYNDYFDNNMTSENELSSILFNESKEEESRVCHIMIKNEPEFENDKNEITEVDLSSIKKKRIFSKESSERRMDNYKSETEKEDIQDRAKIRTPKKKRKFECFFCRIKFTGLKVFTSHKCTVKRVKCEVEGCDSYFINQGGYNQHLHHRHNLPKVSKHFCPVCQTCYQMSTIQFDEHCKKCIEINEYREQQIQCVQCKKICDNLKSYTAHIMLHDRKDSKQSESNETGKINSVKKNKRGKEDKMCDICGKVFDSSGLQRHKLNVHFVNFNGEMFYCDLCPIAKPTKRLLYNHMKSTHIIRWHACETCGKMFRNRELWRKHQLIHGDFKKNNRCDVCPHRPGFVTKAALNKHMRSNHGGAQPIRKYNCDICKASYSRDDLLIRHRASVHQIHQNNYTKEIISQYIRY